MGWQDELFFEMEEKELSDRTREIAEQYKLDPADLWQSLSGLTYDEAMDRLDILDGIGSNKVRI
jgi:hypothetical protein